MRRDLQAILLENVRFSAGEEANDSCLAQELAALSDGQFVNDAFGACHRAQASVTGVAQHVERALPGLLIRRELKFLWSAVQQPHRCAHSHERLCLAAHGSLYWSQVALCMWKRAQKG